MYDIDEKGLFKKVCQSCNKMKNLYEFCENITKNKFLIFSGNCILCKALKKVEKIEVLNSEKNIDKILDDVINEL